MSPSPQTRSALRRFLASEAGGGITLMIASALAMIIANSPLEHAYHALLHDPVAPAISAALGPTTLHLIINDGLMAIFFLFVGLEIKRELVDGRLANPSQRRLPIIAAAAGMAVPAAIYIAVVGQNPALFHGWAIPAATDIAFAIAVLALLGSRAPTSLKLLLVTIAIADDMGAVAIIALVYSGGLNLMALGAAALIFIAMLLIGRLGVRSIWPFLLGFVLLWGAVLMSGVHATIAGVLAAFAIPIVASPGQPDAHGSPLYRLEHALSWPVGFIIVPLFGFANAGVALADLAPKDIVAAVPLGVALGLFLGKQIGIFAAIALCVALGIAPRPRGATWVQIYGVSLLCGIGFTMSLFIGGLAFADPELVEAAKLGTLAGSILSALLGFAVLRFATPHPDRLRDEATQASEIDTDGDTR